MMRVRRVMSPGRVLQSRVPTEDVTAPPHAISNARPEIPGASPAVAARGGAEGLPHWTQADAGRTVTLAAFARTGLIARPASASRRACSASAKSSPNLTKRKLLAMTKTYATAW